MNICYIIGAVSEIKMPEKWQRAFLRAFLAFKFAGVVFSSYLCRCNEDAMKMQRGLRAAAQRRPSELTSAFTLHRNCTVITKREAADRCRSSQNNLLTQKLN